MIPKKLPLFYVDVNLEIERYTEKKKEIESEDVIRMQQALSLLRCYKGLKEKGLYFGIDIFSTRSNILIQRNKSASTVFLEDDIVFVMKREAYDLPIDLEGGEDIISVFWPYLDDFKWLTCRAVLFKDKNSLYRVEYIGSHGADDLWKDVKTSFLMDNFTLTRAEKFNKFLI